MKKFPKLPRKLAALYVCLALLLVVAWTVCVAKLATIVTALVALYTAFATGHVFTDIAATKSAATQAKSEATKDEVD